MFFKNLLKDGFYVRFVAFIAILLFSYPSSAVLFTATQSGDWDDATTWDQGGSIPGASDDILVKGDWTVTVNVATAVCTNIQLGSSANPNKGDGILLFNAGAVLVSSGALTFGNTPKTGDLDMSAGGSFTCATWGGTAGSFSPGTGSVKFTGTFTFQNNPIYDGYYNLEIASTGTVTMARSTTISNDLTLSSGTFSCAGKPITISGNWINTGGTFDEMTAANSKVTFSGGNTQTISCAGGETFRNLIVNKSSNELTLNNNVLVSAQLTMTSGNIKTTGQTLELGTDASNAGDLSWTAGTAYGGTFKRWLEIGAVVTPAGLFPVGLSSEHRPVEIVSTSDITTGGSMSVTHSDASSASDVSINDGAIIIERTHDMSSSISLANGLAGGVFNINVTNTSLAASGTLADIRLTNNGDVKGTHAAATGTIDNPTAKRTAVAMADLAGAWKIGTTNKSATPLPIVLLDFTASLIDKTSVRLEWTTASEINNDFFTIERSSNGLSFEPIAEIPGSGTTSRAEDYETYDDSPLDGVSYYRLKQTDYDGQFEYFKIVAVNLERNADGSCVLKVFPNPCIGQCTIDLSNCKHNESAEIKVEMIDAAGNLVFSKIPYRDFEGSFQFNIDTGNNLKPGIYIVRGTSANEAYHSKIIVK